MKKTFTLIALFALVTTSVFANNYTLSWAHTLDGNTAAADNAVEVSKSADGHILVLNSWGVGKLPAILYGCAYRIYALLCGWGAGERRPWKRNYRF